MAGPRAFPVLIATDGSPEGSAAVKAATSFPWPSGARAHGVVVRSGITNPDLPDSAWADIDRGLTSVADQARKVLAPRWPDVEVRVTDGPIVDAILRRAERVGARVIVLGSRGHGPIARLLVGSTSLGVVRAMKHAALVIRGRPGRITRVALGFDGSPSARRAATLLASLDVPRGGRVTIIHVLEQTRLPSASLLPAAARRAILAEAAAVDAAAEQKAVREADAAAAELHRAGWKADVLVRRGAPLYELLAAAKRAGAELLAVGARGHGAVERLLLGSIAEGALHRAPISVLVTR